MDRLASRSWTSTSTRARSFAARCNNPAALTTVRAPIFEEKVVDHLLGQIAVTDKKVSKEELMAEDEEVEAATAKAKKTRKPKPPARKARPRSRKKAPAKKKAAEDADSE